MFGVGGYQNPILLPYSGRLKERPHERKNTQGSLRNTKRNREMPVTDGKIKRGLHRNAQTTDGYTHKIPTTNRKE